MTLAATVPDGARQRGHGHHGAPAAPPQLAPTGAPASAPRLVRSRRDFVSTPSGTASAQGAGQVERPDGPSAAEVRSRSRWRRLQLRQWVAEILPEHRCRLCGREPRRGESVALRRGDDGTHFVSGALSCGAAWVCPDCAAKVSARQAQELRCGLGTARTVGLAALPEKRSASGRVTQRARPAKGPQTVTMVTLTAAHTAHDALAPWIAAFARAQRRLHSGRWWQDFSSAHGVNEHVRNLETMWGRQNGFHHHSHALLLSDDALSPQAEAALRLRWAEACEREGLRAGEHGLKLTDDRAEIEGYVTKVGEPAWGAPEEMTLWHYKTGREGRYTPFDLVRAYGQAKRAGDGAAAERFADLFSEYADAYKGRARLRWSQGMRERLGLGAERSDEQTANDDDAAGEIVHVFSEMEWHVVTQRAGNLELLLDAADSSPEDFRELLASMITDHRDRWRDRQAERWRRDYPQCFQYMPDVVHLAA